MVDFLGNPDRFLLWWMVDGPGQLHVSCRSKVRPLPLGGRPHGAFRPWLVVSNLVTVWIGKRYERETMRFLAGFLLLLLPPPPSEAATNTAGLQECINTISIYLSWIYIFMIKHWFTLYIHQSLRITSAVSMQLRTIKRHFCCSFKPSPSPCRLASAAWTVPPLGSALHLLLQVAALHKFTD